MTTVLIISQQYPPERSANASRIHDMAFYLTKENYDVIVTAPYPTIPFGTYPRVWKLRSTSIVENVKLINLWNWQPKSQAPSFINHVANYLIYPLHAALWSIIHRKEYDVIITSSPPVFTYITGMIVKILLHKPWILEIRDLWIKGAVYHGYIKEGSLFEKLASKLEMWSFMHSDIINVTTHTLGEIISVNDEIKNKISVIPNGADIKLFQEDKMPKKENWIIYAGNIGYAQSLENVIKAICVVNKMHKIVLNLVGDGELVEHLHQVVADEGAEDCVLFTGSVSRAEVSTLLSKAKMGVAPIIDDPIHTYAIPTKIYEYMAAGIPFIGSGHGEIQKITDDSKAGVIAEDTVEGFAKAIIYFLDNPDMMKDMGNKGRDYAVKNCSRESVAMKIKGNIERIL